MSTNDRTALTPKEQAALDEHEASIAAALATWHPKALALTAIHADRLFRARYDSFDEYAEDRWEIRRRQAYNYVASARTAGHLIEAGEPLPVAERHVRPLNGLDPAEAVVVWRSVRRAAGGPEKVTGPAVEKAVEDIVVGRKADDRESGGRLVLSDEAQVEVDAAKAKAMGTVPVEAAPDDGPPAPPLVTVPPDFYASKSGRPQATGPVVVPASYVERPLDADALGGLAGEFERYYEAAGKTGPRMNLTNEHVGWSLWTLNVTTGCTWTCPFCYAREIAELRYPQGFAPTVHPERLLAPANTKIPAKYADDPAARRVFLGSQTDWMDPSFPDEVVRAVIAMCRENPQFQFLTLTKQPGRLKDFEYPENMWIGVTVTRQGQVRAAEEALARVDAAVRWISFEPLHGPVVLSRPDVVDLFVIGAERKTDQRERVKPTRAEWVDALRMQARSVNASVWEKENLQVWLREMPEPRRLS